MEKELKQKKSELTQYKHILKQLKKDTKPLFPNTKFGRAYFKTIKFCTSPFHNIAVNADNALDDPDWYVTHKLSAKLDTLIEECQKVSDRTHRRARVYCLRAATHAMKTERYLMTIEDESVHDVLNPKIDALHSEVARLRPIRTEEDMNQIKETVGNILQNIIPN